MQQRSLGKLASIGLLAWALVGVLGAATLTATPAAASGTGAAPTVDSAPAAERAATPEPVAAGAPAGKPAPTRDIVETLLGDEHFATLAEALRTAGLTQLLKSKGPYTFFAPTDEAWSKLPASARDELLAQPARLKAVLTYHILKGRVDNVGLHTSAIGTNLELFGGVTEENVARIRRQNARKISVIIGNPPYNANQANENDNNKNREYPAIDARIKKTYIAESTAQKTKLYDMYARFFRWASDRLDANGVLAFVTNRSWLDSRTFDGFRKTVASEFAEVRVVDLGGDVRANPKLSGTKHNVFGIQTGVAIGFFVKKAGKRDRARIFYARRPELETAEEKLAFLSQARLATLACEELTPDAKANWLNLTHNDFDELLPVALKASKSSTSARALFSLYTQGVKSNRDEWVWDHSAEQLMSRMRYFIGAYSDGMARLPPGATTHDVADVVGTDIKWTRKLKKLAIARTKIKLEDHRVVPALYRPFTRQVLYFSPELNEDTYRLFELFGDAESDNLGIVFTDTSPRSAFSVLACEGPFEHHLAASTDSFQCVPLRRLDSDGRLVDNITDWALKQFTSHYKAGTGKRLSEPTKEGIFHYVYAVLHDPLYRDKYAQNLKREFPRVPLYGTLRADFWRWADWGRELMDLHIGYETVEPWPLQRTDTPDEKARAAGQAPRCILKSEPEAGRIVVDSETVLAGVPSEAWGYRLGNRSAIDWVLDQHKERKPKDPTIRAKFDTYRFAGHKERVIDLLARVVRVSVQTLRIADALKAGPR